MNLDVSEIITQVRDQLDEVNTINVTDSQIIAALNRGQRKGTNIIARKFDDLFLMSDETTTTVAGTRNYDIPANAYGRRIEKVELVENGIAWEIKKISFHDTTRYNSNAQVTRPYYYTQKKNEILLYPTPSSGQTLRIWYTDKPEELVTPQGRITHITDGADDSVIVDSLGSNITVDTSSGFNAYVNIIDYNTGDIKGSMQIASINTSTRTITFKSSDLTRSSVLGRTIGTTLPTDAAVDDYICIISGTCIPEIPGAYVDYLTQYAVVEIRRRLGEDTTTEFAALKEVELELEKMWVGRESSHRIRKSNTHWHNSVGSSLRRLLR